MEDVVLVHRDINSRIQSLSDISRSSSNNEGRSCNLRLDPDTNRLLLTYYQKNPPPPKKTDLQDEGFESDMDNISLTSLETPDSDDSALGSAGTLDTISRTNLEETFNLVDCVCYTHDQHYDILVLVAYTETLVFRFAQPNHLRTFHANFSTMKAVSSAMPSRLHFNLLQRTDPDGITHIRISAEEDDHPSIVSLPNLSPRTSEPLRKTWRSIDNLLLTARPRPPSRRPRKGPAPPPPPMPKPPIIIQHHFGTIPQSKISHANRQRTYEAFKFSDPKNVIGLKDRTECGTTKNQVSFGTMPSWGTLLRGMSAKLKSMGRAESMSNLRADEQRTLRGVIKKQERDVFTARAPAKKVTFSAFNTVQVV